jgi:hypothetical protein
VLGYNGGMENIDATNITDYEKETIDLWSKTAKNAGYIRDIVRKNFKNLNNNEKKLKDNAIALINMFKKYDSAFSKNKPLYRGKSFYIQKSKDKKLYNDYVNRVFLAYNQNRPFIPDSVFRSSSKILKEALKFAEIDNMAKRSIVVTYNKRISNELDISKISKFTSENEILLNGNISYRVIKLRVDEHKNIFITLEEI